MKYLIPIIVAVALLAGCGCPSVYEIYLWEFQISIPSETEPSAVIDLENKLRQAGFRKIVFRKHFEIVFVDRKSTRLNSSHL